MMIKQNVIEQQMGQKRNWKLRNTLNKSRNMMLKNLKNVAKASLKREVHCDKYLSQETSLKKLTITPPGILEKGEQI